MKRFPWRILLYGVFFLYLVLDLKVCHGPLKRSFTKQQRSVAELAEEKGWVALVNQEPISKRQLDVAVTQHWYQRGKVADEVSPKNLKIIRFYVLNQLIDDLLIKQFADSSKVEVPQAEIDQFIETWEAQFGSEEELKERSAMQGLDAAERRRILGELWTTKQWLEERIEPGISVTDEEVRAWYEANKDSGEGFQEPEKVKVRHLFLSTVVKDPKEQEQLIHELHRKIAEGEATFEDLIREYSEDARTKDRGGDLNWLARDRVSKAFADQVFAQEVGVLSEPFRTRIGWHLAIVDEKRGESPVPFEAMQAEIRNLLESERTVSTIERLKEKQRKVSNIQIFAERM